MSRHLREAQIINGAKGDKPAPDVKPALEALDNIRKAARTLVRACEAIIDPQSKVFIRTKLEALFPRNLCASAHEKVRFDEWVGMVRSVALYAPQNPDELLDGDAWSKTTASQAWVNDLRAFAEQEELPTGAKSDLRANGEPSEFIKFVHELMKTIPSEFRHCFADDEGGDVPPVSMSDDQKEPDPYKRIAGLISRASDNQEKKTREREEAVLKEALHVEKLAQHRRADLMELVRQALREAQPDRFNELQYVGRLEAFLASEADQIIKKYEMLKALGRGEDEAWLGACEQFRTAGAAATDAAAAAD
jgi:hypothetical protein